jgi:acetyl-CoA carboxylase biotin carboxylase subunit
VPLDYDPMLAKLAVWAETRGAAIERARRALNEYSVAGIRTNLAFFREILDDPEFRSGRLHTGFIEEFFRRRPPAREADEELRAVAALVAAIHDAGRQKDTALPAANGGNRWTADGRRKLLR